MTRDLRMNVIVDVRGMNVNTHVGADLTDGMLYAERQRRSVIMSKRRFLPTKHSKNSKREEGDSEFSIISCV